MQVSLADIVEYAYNNPELEALAARGATLLPARRPDSAAWSEAERAAAHAATQMPWELQVGAWGCVCA